MEEDDFVCKAARTTGEIQELIARASSQNLVSITDSHRSPHRFAHVLEARAFA